MGLSQSQRIVTLAPSNTEILFALGEEGRLVGVSSCDTYPPQVEATPKVGGFASPDVEKVKALAPDLVLATEIDLRRAVPQLEAQGVATHVVKVRTVLDVPDAVVSIGERIGCEQKALPLARELRTRIENVQRRISASPERPGVCYLCSHDPLCGGARGRTVTELIEVAGGEDILLGVDADSIEALLEAAARRNPQVIITSKGHRGTNALSTQVMDEPRFKATDACRYGRIHQIDAALVCRRGPRAVSALEALAGFIHPEIFG